MDVAIKTQKGESDCKKLQIIDLLFIFLNEKQQTVFK